MYIFDEPILDIKRMDFLEEKMRDSKGIIAFVDRLNKKIPANIIQEVINEWMGE